METLTTEMSRAEMRVAIAKDVIAQIKSQKLRVKCGRYITFVNEKIMEIGDQAILLNPETPACQVCGIGAAIYSAIRLFNTVQTKTIGGNEFLARDLITKWFTPEQACLIECAFEIDTHLMRNASTTDEQRRAARAFGSKYDDDPEERAIAILQNIADNGEFRP